MFMNNIFIENGLLNEHKQVLIWSSDSWDSLFCFSFSFLFSFFFALIKSFNI